MAGVMHVSAVPPGGSGSESAFLIRERLRGLEIPLVALVMGKGYDPDGPNSSQTLTHVNPDSIAFTLGTITRTRILAIYDALDHNKIPVAVLNVTGNRMAAFPLRPGDTYFDTVGGFEHKKAAYDAFFEALTSGLPNT